VANRRNGRCRLKSEGDASQTRLWAYVNVLDQARMHFGRQLLLHLRPPWNGRHDETGLCSVCGIASRFAFNSWVIPADQFEECDDVAVSVAYERRESLFCHSCCSSLRVRGIASVLLELYGNGARSMAELVSMETFRGLDVAEVNPIGSMDSLHVFLKRLPHLAFSKYPGPDRLGALIDGARNEDICRLTYSDASFDLVLSSDTLEHVPDFVAALRETCRVLRPGGRHILTVPIVVPRERTFPRVEVGQNGELIHRLPPLYHGRGRGLYRYKPVGGDLLTFTEFGRDLTDFMRAAGFEPEVMRGADAADETGATLVFVGRRPV
jgi:hypothetical protein